MEPKSNAEALDVVGRLIDAYIMGEKFQDTEFLHTVMRCLIQRLKSSSFDARVAKMNWLHIHAIWTRSVTTSCLRLLALEVMANTSYSQSGPSHRQYMLNQVPPEFWLDQLIFLKAKSNYWHKQEFLLDPERFLEPENSDPALSSTSEESDDHEEDTSRTEPIRKQPKRASTSNSKGTADRDGSARKRPDRSAQVKTTKRRK